MAQLDKIRLSGTTYDIIDSTAVHSLDGYYTAVETNAAITAATNALAESIAEQGYQTSEDVQTAISGKADTTAVTQSISEATSGKADTTAVTQAISEATSGKVDTTTYTAYTAATDTALEGKADISDIPSVTGYADSVQYNTTSKYVEFFHGGTGGTKVYEFDASPFLIDGMVESVVITSITSGASEVTVLEITWNSAAGGQVTDIPLSEIFDASNYYTKSQVDTALANKADLSAATITTSESGTVTSSITGTYSVDLQYDYSDSVYYFSGHMQSIQYMIESFTIKYSDGTNEVSVNQNQTGETSDYTFTMTVSDFVFQTKGSKKITRVNFTFDSSNKTLDYTYKYSNDTEIAVSTYIEDEINPALSNKVDTTTYTAYTAATDTVIGGKADTTALTGVNDALTAHTADTTIHVTSSDKTTWNGKQDALVSGTNIKTINGSSVLGSGDLTVDTGLHAEVSGTTLIFS